MTLETFTQGITLVQKCFDLVRDPDTWAIWRKALADISDEDFAAAVMHIVRTREYLPANINLAAVIRETVEKSDTSAEEAWGDVLREVARTGSWGIPEFTDESTKNTVNIIGWKEICLTEQKNMGTIRAHFYRTYNAVRQRQKIKSVDNLIEGAKLKRLAAQIGKQIGSGTKTSGTSANRPVEGS